MSEVQHAKREGKSFMSEIVLAGPAFERITTVLKAADGGAEARVPVGSVTGGQFTVGSDGPSTAPNKPNPYGKKTKQGGKSSKPGKPGSSSGKTKKTSNAAHRSQLLGQRHELRDQLSGLFAEKKKLTTTGVRSFGTGSTIKKPAGTAAASKPSKTSASTSSGKPSSKKTTLAQVNAQIAQVKERITAINDQLQANKSARNPRDVGTGRFRTFQGEIQEARQALSEGRMADAIDLLGSARVLARTPQERTIVGDLQSALVRVRHDSTPLTKSQVAWLNSSMGEINKVGPHGYSHG